MSLRNLDQLFKPTSIALVEIRPSAPRVSAAVCRNLLRAGFNGEIAAVLPNGGAINDISCCCDVPSLTASCDLAIVSAPPESLPALIGDLGSHGTKAAILVADGCDSHEQAGIGRQQTAMLAAARPHGLRILGPGSLGIMVPHARINASIADIQPLSGNLALVGQSGAALLSVVEAANSRNLGFSHVISLGRMADVDYGDALDYLANDADTRAILFVIESLTQVRKFLSAARAATRNLPVVALKAGRFQQPAWRSTSPPVSEMMTTSLYDALFRRCGMVPVSELEELLETAQTLTTARSPTGNRFAIVANGRDLAWLAADTLFQQGGHLANLSSESIQHLAGLLASNGSPNLSIDLGIGADATRYANVLEILLADPGVDAVIALHAPNMLSSCRETAEAVIEALRKRTAKSPVPALVTSWIGGGSAAEARQIFAKNRIPCHETPDAAVRGAMQPLRYRRLQDQLVQTVPPLPDDFVPDTEKARGIISMALAEGRHWLDGPEARDVLAAYGVPVVPCHLAANAEDAAEIARTMGQPVALKIHSPDILDKSAAGGVALHLDTPEQVKQAAAAMWEDIGRTLPGACRKGFCIEPMISRDAAPELMIAVVEEACLGPVFLLGRGGIACDSQELAAAIPPLDLNLAREFIERARIHRLLEGTPGVHGAALESIALTLVKISHLICDLDAIVEININPLLAWNQEVVVADAWLRIDGQAPPIAQRLAIRPYPKELEEILRLPDGQTLLLRPIRPEDEPLYVELFERLSPDEIFFRFLSRMRTLSHKLAARLTQLDYDRDMALVLVGQRPNGESELYGGVRIMAAPDTERAEFAIVLRGDMTGLGLGPMLLRRIIDYAQSRGIVEIYGEVLNDNRPMLKLCQVFGFTAKRSFDDPEITHVSLKLQSECAT
ncbi:MAG TPA: GNAT family N-acetyltransferase [Syntrophobacteraceae bacterium]|nr:GNAT family N-acetyltransferase [Syntrophobacteraceae bacterium]